MALPVLVRDGTTGAVRQRDVAVRHLDGGMGFTSELADRLDDLGHPPAVRRVVVAEPAAVRVERQPSVRGYQGAVEHEPTALSFLAESQVLDRLEHRDREGVVDGRIVDIGRCDAGLGKGTRSRDRGGGAGQVDAPVVGVTDRLRLSEDRDARTFEVAGHLGAHDDDCGATVGDDAAVEAVQRRADHGGLEHFVHRDRGAQERVGVVLRMERRRHLHLGQLGTGRAELEHVPLGRQRVPGDRRHAPGGLECRLRAIPHDRARGACPPLRARPAIVTRATWQ